MYATLNIILSRSKSCIYNIMSVQVSALDYKLVGASLLLFCATLLVGCEGEESLFDSNRGEGTPPSIDQITPSDSAEAGSTITIQGSHFLSDPEANYVYFGAQEGTIESASSSELEVSTPAVADTFTVRAATRAAEDFSNKVTYILYK